MMNFIIYLMIMLFSSVFNSSQRRLIASAFRLSSPVLTSTQFKSFNSLHRFSSPRTMTMATSDITTTQSSTSSANPLNSPLSDFLFRKSTNSPQFIFVGGKGGVGKTSTSSAIAISLSNKGYRTLIVSTDPAHSLGDALNENLNSGVVKTIVTEPSLWALEIDVDAALEEFRATAGDLDADTLSQKFGVPRDIIDTLGLEDMASLFTNPPPGIDEIVALTKIFDYADQKLPDGRPLYDRIIIDTAPTGHTVRLLQLPAFLTTVTSKLIAFRSKISSAVNTFKSLFGGEQKEDAMVGILEKLESLQSRLARMKVTLKDEDKTRFVIVTIPTTLAVAESKRLVESLQMENIGIAAIVVNQVVSDSVGINYLQTRRRGQQTCLNELKALPTKLEVTEVPYFDTEVTGIYGLRFFASVAHKPEPKSATNPIDSRKLTVFGGKGGVGKTTSAASWAVQLADSGLKVLVVSTDPAHSLGDSLQESLSGVPRLIDKSPSGGQLWAMEVDPSSALQDFKDIVQDAVGSKKEGSAPSGGGMMGAMGLPDMGAEVMDMISGVDEPPPGTDEVVAMAQVVTFLEDGIDFNGSKLRFDRVVLDTAPTGHTLRMLTLPVFMKSLMQRLRKISGKVKSLGGMFGMGGDKSEVDEKVNAEAGDRLKKFEARMDRLQDLLHNPKESEFTVVTIATDMATAETKRLVQSLSEEKILVRRLIVNQLISEQDETDAGVASSAYLNRLRGGQKQAINTLTVLATAADVPLLIVPYFEYEVRTVYGLRAIGKCFIAVKV